MPLRVGRSPVSCVLPIPPQVTPLETELRDAGGRLDEFKKALSALSLAAVALVERGQGVARGYQGFGQALAQLAKYEEVRARGGERGWVEWCGAWVVCVESAPGRPRARTVQASAVLAFQACPQARHAQKPAPSWPC